MKTSVAMTLCFLSLLIPVSVKAQCDNCPPPQVVIYGVQINVSMPAPDDTTTGAYTTSTSQQAFLNWVALGDVFVSLGGIANNDPEASCVRWSQGSSANQLATSPDSALKVHLENYWTGDVPPAGTLGGVDYLIWATLDSSGGSYHFKVSLEDGYTRDVIASGSADFSAASGAVTAANSAIAAIEPVFDKIRAYQMNLRSNNTNMALSAQITVIPSQPDVHITQTIPISFQVTDCDGTPLKGFTLTVGGSNGSFDQPSIVTDGSGQATSNFTAGSTPGVANITALCYPYTTPMHKQRGSHGDGIVTIDNPGMLIWQLKIKESEDQHYSFDFDTTTPDNLIHTHQHEEQYVHQNGSFTQYILSTITDTSINTRAVYGGSGDQNYINTDKVLKDVSFSSGGGSLEDDFTVAQGWISKDETFTDDLDLVGNKFPNQPPAFAFLTAVMYDGIGTGSSYYQVKPDQNHSASTQTSNGDSPITDAMFMYLTQFATYPPSPQVSSSFSGGGTSFSFSGTYHADSTYDVTQSGQKNALYNALVSVSISPYKVPTGVTASQDNLPMAYRLYANYPNPFNPTTVISYQLPVSGYVTLKIYDVLGREIQSLVDGQQEAGNHSVSFNGANLTSGVYFYTLHAGNFTQTKKLMLVK